MIKKRTRPQPRIREPSPEVPDAEHAAGEGQEEERNLPLADLIELRKLRRARQGIDAAKLVVGDERKKRKKRAEGEEEAEEGGLKKGAAVDEDEEDKEEDKIAKARKAVRTSNFTQQTNTLDVDKHMMAYIEENMQKQKGVMKEPETVDEGPADPFAELHKIADRYKAPKKGNEEEGSVTNSLAMLTAIPEVDLGMDARLKNIEETEKAKRMVAEERKAKKASTEDDQLASRFFRTNHRPKSDADTLRDAKLEAMGLPPQEGPPRRTGERNQMATDEMVMERFKKRMRK